MSPGGTRLGHVRVHRPPASRPIPRRRNQKRGTRQGDNQTPEKGTSHISRNQKRGHPTFRGYLRTLFYHGASTENAGAAEPCLAAGRQPVDLGAVPGFTVQAALYPKQRRLITVASQLGSAAWDIGRTTPSSADWATTRCSTPPARARSWSIDCKTRDSISRPRARRAL